MTRTIAEADRPLDDREVVSSLHSPIPDGGWWPEFARLVAKYGIVPAYAMPDTVSAGDSDAMNEHLATLLRRMTLRLRAAVADGEDPEPLRVAALEQVHRMLCIHLGTPPSEFVWQYRDKNKEFHRIGTLTPLEFAQRYVTGVEEFVVLAHDPRPEITVNTRYGMDRSDVMVGAPVQDHVTAGLDVMKAAAIAAIQDGEPVWFACDVAKQRDKNTGIWDAGLHDYEGLYGVDLSMTKAERLVARESALTHAMCLTGVDLVDGVPQRWRVENSWGDKLGEKGFHTMSDSWFDEYVFEVVVRASRLPDKVRAALGTEPVMLPSWDPMA
ncbi:C1 family peptidase [Actinomyces viscosus]|uniref:aminopeptidase C n=1 Tax=Actinomyces viscosus TaxID=1656 RepID=UPI0038B9FA80